MTISMSKPTKPDELVIYQDNFTQKFQDIVENLQITADLTITYRDREPVTIASRLQEYLKQISPVERNQYLAARLQKYLYSLFSFDLQLEKSFSLEISNDTAAKELGDRQEVANYVNKWSRTKFYQQLVQNNHGEGYSDPNWLVVKQEADYWHVTKNDLTLHIKPEKHLAEPIQLQPGQLVAIKMPPNLVDRGFYIAIANSGPIKAADSSDDFIIQMYFNVSSQGALLLLDHLSRELNSLKIPFNFRVAYDETNFAELDAVVLDIKSSDFELVYPIVETIEQKIQPYFRPKIPFFCLPLSPGWGLAEKPRSPKFEQENIGQHYCGIIATALVEKWQEDGLTENKLTDVWNYLSLAGVDIEHLYLNPDSTKSYQAQID